MPELAGAGSVSEPRRPTPSRRCSGAGGGVAIDQPALQLPDGDGGWIDPNKNVVVKTYIPVDEEAEEKRRAAGRGGLAPRAAAPRRAAQVKVIAEEDWASSWKRFFFPHRVGKRLVIVPSWRRAREPGRPGASSGSRHGVRDRAPPTTRMCLALLEEHVRPGHQVFDFGCGSAILSIAAARLGARRIEAVDVDAIAVEVAKENARRNKVARKIRVRKGTVEPGQPGRGRRSTWWRRTSARSC